VDKDECWGERERERPKLLYASAYVGFAMIAFSIMLAAASILPYKTERIWSATMTDI
jgi:hypothetical protein